MGICALDFDFDFEKCLLHGPISINIPDNKATKYPKTKGYLHQKRFGGIMYTKSQGVRGFM